ncbi:MAG: hypothetical protein R2909_11705 [Gemmatimonadales bacterium]
MTDWPRRRFALRLALAGPPTEMSTNGPITTREYRWQDGTLEADLVHGVLVGSRIVAR